MKFIRTCTLIFIALFTIICTDGQSVIQHKYPMDPTVDYTRLQHIDTMINGYVNRGWVPGVVVLVVKDGNIVLNKGYGYSNLVSKKPMLPNSIFRIASQTKAIVSAGIMVLWDEGKISLSDPVLKFLPGFAHQTVLDQFNAEDTTYTTVPVNRPVTIKELLTHTSGIDYPGIGTDKMRAIYEKERIPNGLSISSAPLIDEMNRLGQLPLAFQPGTQWRYSLSIDVLGAVIEVVSQMNLEEFLLKKFFLPLSMEDTRFNIPVSKKDRLVTVYTEDSLQKVIPWSKTHLGVDPDYPVLQKHYFSGGGGLSSTAMDYAVFLQMILNGGSYNGRKILSPRAVEMMLHNQLDFPFNGRDYFGLGFGIISDKGSADRPRNEGTFYWGGFFGTFYFSDPKEKMIVLFMTQHTPKSHGDLESKFEQMLYGSLN